MGSVLTPSLTAGGSLVLLSGAGTSTLRDNGFLTRFNADNLFTQPISPDTLIAACRAKVQATLPEITEAPETLEGAQALDARRMPFVVLIMDEGTDVSAQYGVNDEASLITVDFVYVAQRAGDGETDDSQTLRARLNVLLNAFLADYHLGGLVTQTDLVHTPANRANAYQQMFAEDGNAVAVMTLSLAFTLVFSALPNSGGLP